METITPLQNKALCLLAAGYTVSEVVEMTGVGKRTLDRWRTTPEFKRLLQEAVAATYDAAVAELVAGSRQAALKLKEIIDSPDVASKTKVTAINVLLANAARAKDSVLEQRLEVLEGTLDGINTEQD